MGAVDTATASQPRSPSRGTRGLVLLLCLGYACLAAAWAVADPPGAPPDESAHHVRAVAAGRLDLRGRPPAAVEPPSGPDAEAVAWMNQTARLFTVPPELSPLRLRCLPVEPTLTTCGEQQPPHPTPAARSYVGTYQPWAYLLPGLATRGAGDAATALRRARLANVVLWVGLVATAALLLVDRDRPGLSLVGLVLAVTPMTVFLGASVAPSGTEVVAAICYWGALLRLSRPGPPPRWSWAALAASGVVLASGRSLGPGWVGFGVLVFAVVHGPRPAWERFRQGGMASRAAAVAIVLGAICSLAWELAFQPHAPLRASVVVEGVWPSVEELPELFAQYVGVFGPLSVRMRESVYWLWGALVAVLVAGALVLGRRRERWAMAVLLVCCPVAAVVLSVAVVRQTGFGMQGRYVAPLLVAVPLVAGEVVLRHRDRLPRRLGAVAVGVVAVALASVHLLGWYVNGRRYAVGSDGPRVFMGVAHWSPPGGWWLWTVTAVVGGVLLLAATVLAVRRELVSETDGSGGRP